MFGSHNVFLSLAIGLVRTVVSISHCGCDDPGSIPGLDTFGPVSSFAPLIILFYTALTFSKSWATTFV